MAVTRGLIFDEGKVLGLSLEGMKELAITHILEARRINGGLTRNAETYAASTFERTMKKSTLQ